MSVAIMNKTVLVTGANRGLGRALVDEALSRGAKRVYAASRRPMVVPDQRVTPLVLDVTVQAQIQDAADGIESLDILINNAGVSVAETYSIGSYGKDGTSESAPVGGPTTNYDCDIIYSNGAFVQYAEGVQQ